jgi:hypothetical protein
MSAQPEVLRGSARAHPECAEYSCERNGGVGDGMVKWFLGEAALSSATTRWAVAAALEGAMVMGYSGFGFGSMFGALGAHGLRYDRQERNDVMV